MIFMWFNPSVLFSSNWYRYNWHECSIFNVFNNVNKLKKEIEYFYFLFYLFIYAPFECKRLTLEPEFETNEAFSEP